jgi:hypothetical protein
VGIRLVSAKTFITFRGTGLRPRLKRIPRTSGLLRGVKWFETDVSGLPIGLIFKCQTVHEEVSFFILDSLILEDGTREVVLKRRFQTTLRRVITQKTEECITFFYTLYLSSSVRVADVFGTGVFH